jgi:hypothetical protein
MRLALWLSLLAAAPAFAQGTPATQQAETLNEQGKKLYKDKDWSGAATKFREAIQLSADARFYFNLCATLEKLGDYDGALKACDEVYTHNPSEALKAKTGERAAEVRKRKDEAAAGGGGGSPETGGGQPPTGSGGTGGGTETGAGTGGGAPVGATTTTPEVAATEEALAPGDYRFSVGADLGIARNRSIGDSDASKDGGVLKLHADFYILPMARLGLRASLDFFNFSGGGRGDVVLVDRWNLGITEFGGGIFWHLRITDAFWITPLGGVSMAILQPSREDVVYADDPYVTLGFRLETVAQYLFGGGHHAISAGPILCAYLPATNDNAVLLPERWGLDKGGVAWAITLGYTYRFTEALPAFVTLE